MLADAIFDVPWFTVAVCLMEFVSYITFLFIYLLVSVPK